MSMPQDQLIEIALSLPEYQRADLALYLLQSLEAPGEPVSSDEFGAELHARIAAYRRREIESIGLDEARATVRRRLEEGSKK